MGSFLTYIMILIYFVFFAELFGRTHLATEYRYNLVPFKEIKRFIMYYDTLGTMAVFLNLAGNVLAFMPLGFFCHQYLDIKWDFGVYYVRLVH